MRKLFFVLLLVLPYALQAQKATIKIDVDRTIGEIDPKIYGVFMEPIHFSRENREGDTTSFNTMYGSLYDPSSPLANEDGFRKDYIDAMKELQVTNMRWPGGNYAMGYNWQDGIGPKDQRPTNINLAWGGKDNNHVGTDEWVALNEAMGSENVVCVNLGLGDIKNAVNWVEYCNYKGGTHFSDLRAKYGHPEPYDIKIWGLGNEVDGAPWELGHKTAEDYVKVAKEAAKAMRAVDSSIKLVASGSSYYEPTNQWIDWNKKVISELTGVADYLSIHRYWESTDDYYQYIGAGSFDVEEKINTVQAQVNVAQTRYPDKEPLKLAVDEWAPFGQSLRSTLAVAEFFNSFIRHADFVKVANYTLMTSLLQNNPEEGTFKTPLFYTFKLFSTNCRGNSIDTHVDSGTFDTEKYKNIPYLDVTSVYSEETNTVFINVVNRHKDKAITTDILNSAGGFTGNAEASVITLDKVDEPYTYSERDQYQPEQKEVKSSRNKMTYTFLPHSFTQIKVVVERK